MRIYKEFDLFTRALVNSKDVDPTYMVLKDIIKYYGFEPEWFAFVYVGFYNIETAIKMCKLMPEKDNWNPKKFKELRQEGFLSKFGHERRGTARNVDVQIKMFGEIVEAINAINNFQFEEQINTNEDFREYLTNISQHSTWACFKLAEVFEKALDYRQFKINDLGIIGKDPNSSDGTIAGLRLLTGGKEEVFDKYWYPIWDNFGAKLAKAYNYDIGCIETSFCKFNKMSEGKYYVGHDIDEMFELKEVLGKQTYNSIMKKHFDEQFQATNGVRKHIKNTFKDSGFVFNAHYALTTKPVDVGEILLSVL